jgi:hypothetical protein
LALSSLASGHTNVTRMVRSTTVGDLTSANSLLMNIGSNSKDIEYEPVESFSGKPVVKSATTESLISLIAGDVELRRNVILTYRWYLSPADFLGRLMLYYTRTPDYDSERLYLKMFSMLETIRSGVVDSVVLWGKLCPQDFVLDSVRALMKRFIALLKDTSADETAIQSFGGFFCFVFFVFFFLCQKDLMDEKMRKEVQVADESCFLDFQVIIYLNYDFFFIFFFVLFLNRVL